MTKNKIIDYDKISDSEILDTKKEKNKYVENYCQLTDKNRNLDPSHDILNIQDNINYQIEQILNDKADILIAEHNKSFLKEKNYSSLYGNTNSKLYCLQNNIKKEIKDTEVNKKIDKDELNNSKKEKKSIKRLIFEESLQIHNRKIEYLKNRNKFSYTLFLSQEEYTDSKNYKIQNKIADPDIY